MICVCVLLAPICGYFSCLCIGRCCFGLEFGYLKGAAFGLYKMPQLETGDKIIMPPSALDRLAALHIDYPMLFELHNVGTERVSHCGVLEFIAEEGMIYMPYWMMQNLLLQEGDIVHVKNATLPKGLYAKLQPHTQDFLDISNPKAILETTLRNYSCLTTGDSIMVTYNNKKYYIDIVETKPSSAVSIIETDCEVDFAPPLDYREPKRQRTSVFTSKAPAQVQDAQDEAEDEHRFTPFTGVRRRLESLDGKPPKDQAPSITSSVKDPKSEAMNSTKQSTPSTSQSSSSRQNMGKLVFGSNSSRASREAQKDAPKEMKEEPKFQAFTGKKYSLRD
ncbi:Ubiquitin fusion degradation protein [Musa troglodytarum]|uniref:Ubiquitin fusion degradation protein n=1 Tax=Musa troglodytarum TaxID=320322 RepID=A0A9E7EGB0_9LILI|nr:Ubiquitin fusion degradation protein [Musa troglodytarum]